MEAIRDECEKYQLENIYNVDETGLQWKLMPRRSYLSIHEDRQTARGTKDMHYKDRASAFMCTNAPGTNKVEEMMEQLNGTNVEEGGVFDDEKEERDGESTGCGQFPTLAGTPLRPPWSSMEAP